jgi:hypothetical protein
MVRVVDVTRVLREAYGAPDCCPFCLVHNEECTGHILFILITRGKTNKILDVTHKY